MTHDASTALQNVDVNVTASDTEREDAETTSTKREQIQTTTATGAGDGAPAPDEEKRARADGDDDAGNAADVVAPKRQKPASAKERAPRPMDVDALPAALGDWKRDAEVGLKNLWARERLRLLDWFETKAMINTCIVSCPAAALREKMRELRDNGVYGSSMTPYLLLLRDVFDETDAYVDDLDEELNFNDFFDDEESESEEESEEENVPVVARSRGAAAEQEETPQQRVGASRSAPSVEEMDEIKAKFSRFGQFLGQYFTEKRLDEEKIEAIVDAAAAEGFDDPHEVNKFLEIMQRQNKIMYDQNENEWTVYII